MAELKDSGARRSFGTGAVRDIAEGKGRCDLLPLMEVAYLLGNDPFLKCMAKYQKTGNIEYLFAALHVLHGEGCRASYHPPFPDAESLVIGISQQFEDGARKYGPDNWRKGIPARCYMDSACRHYMKWRRGDRDEPHDRACGWNVICMIWELMNHDQSQYDAA